MKWLIGSRLGVSLAAAVLAALRDPGEQPQPAERALAAAGAVLDELLGALPKR